ncbi:MAG: zf-HC2 domain-containing protein [Myxococcota bacterium]
MSSEFHLEGLHERVLAGETLSAEEHRRLEAHVAGCPACQIQRMLTEAAEPQEGDDILAASLVEGAIARVRPDLAVAQTEAKEKPRTSKRVVASVLAAAVFFGSGVAAAFVVPELVEWVGEAGVDPSNATTPKNRSGPEVLRPEVAVPEPAEPEGHGSPNGGEDPSEDVPTTPDVREVPSADTLLERATVARRSGQARRAAQLYRTLQQHHPASSEAGVSRVSLGRLYLDRLSNPRGALGQFDAYLRSHRRGALAEEARVGRAMALQRLGGGPHEAAAWRQLLEFHPASVHGARARTRLAELEGTEPH